MDHHVKQAPVQGVTGLWGGTQGALTSGGGEGPVYVDDVFSTYLFEGNSSTQTITNGIDFSGEGGMVWCKTRGSGTHHEIADTVRGTSQPRVVRANESDPQSNGDTGNGFTSTGFSLSFTSGDVNWTGRAGVSWSFRRSSGFFDVITYTGSGSTQTLAHSLESTPGMIMVKRLDSNSDWGVYHRGQNGGSDPEDYRIKLNTTTNQNNDTYWGDTAPTTTHFTVGDAHTEVNADGGNYVAYIFAHDEQSFGASADSSVIKCGNYTGNGSTNGPDINLGWEPQWVMVKNTTTAGGLWLMGDNMRGVVNGGNDPYLQANGINAEYTAYDWIEFTPTGFKLTNTGVSLNYNGNNYVYTAIRRSDGYVGKPATAGTDVLSLVYGTNSTNPSYVTNFPVDWAFSRRPTTTESWYVAARLIQDEYLVINSEAAEVGNTNQKFDFQNGWHSQSANLTSYFSWNWKRHAGFDVVTYDGTSGNQTQNHSLGQVPEMIITKPRTFSDWWGVYHVGNGNNKLMRLNTNGAAYEDTYAWQSTTPTSTVFYLGLNDAINKTGESYIAFLFSSVTGISKVGSYSGSNSSQTITTGFQPRFLIVKKTDTTQGWVVLDTVRGWASGDDERLEFHNDSAQNDSIDFGAPTSTGFTLTGNVEKANQSGGSYVYYAHA